MIPGTLCVNPPIHRCHLHRMLSNAILTVPGEAVVRAWSLTLVYSLVVKIGFSRFSGALFHELEMTSS